MEEKDEKIASSRKSAIIVGILFIIATVFLFIGESFYKPILSSPDYLEITYPERLTVVTGILLEFACVLAIPLISIVLFPILKVHNEVLALGYVVFRFFEAVLFIFIEINKLSLISLSQAYLESGSADASYFHITGVFIQALTEWAFSMYVIVFAFGALMLYFVLYRSKLVPRLISAWGFLGAILLLAGTLMIMLEMFSGTSLSELELIFVLPIAVNEMVLAVWLIIKGFNPSVIGEG